MKKSVIKRRKRVVPAANEPENNNLHRSSFTISPSPTPQQLDNPNPTRARLGTSVEHHSPLDLRPNPLVNESLEVHDDRRISSGMHPNHSPNSDPRNQRPSIDQQYDPPPIGVDFTGFQLDNRNRCPSIHPHQQPQPPNRFPSVANLDLTVAPSETESSARLSPFSASRKRSHSIPERSSPSPSTVNNDKPPRLSSISAILNAPQQNSTVEDVFIDPNLSTLPPQLQQHRHSTPLPHLQHALYHDQQHHLLLQAQAQGTTQREKPRQSTSSDPGGWELIDKKTRLRKEAEQMRELLRSKERELEELERNGG